MQVKRPKRADDISIRLFPATRWPSGRAIGRLLPPRREPPPVCRRAKLQTMQQ